MRVLYRLACILRGHDWAMGLTGCYEWCVRCGQGKALR
jgi:hypothetical protein